MQGMHALSCLTLCDPMDCSLPGSSSVRGISQIRRLEWLPFPLQGIFLIEPASPSFPTLQADSLPAEPLGKPLLDVGWVLNPVNRVLSRGGGDPDRERRPREEKAETGGCSPEPRDERLEPREAGRGRREGPSPGATGGRVACRPLDLGGSKNIHQTGR